MRSVLIATLMLLVAGCAASPPTRFYTLDPIKPVRHAAASASSLTLQVAAIHIPAVLDRQQMVSESAPDRLHVSDRNRWGAPLAEMMRRVLEQDLLARLPGVTLLPASALAPQRARVLVIDVLRFGSGPSGRVRFEGSWSVFTGGSEHPDATHSVTLSAQAPSGDFAAQAAAMSRLLGRLSEHIAASLRHGAPADPAAKRAVQNHP